MSLTNNAEQKSADPDTFQVIPSIENSKAGKARGVSSQHNSLPLKCGRTYILEGTHRAWQPGNASQLSAEYLLCASGYMFMICYIKTQYETKDAKHKKYILYDSIYTEFKIRQN